METDTEHRLAFTDEMQAILELLKALESKMVFEGQKRNQPLSNMAMLILLRRMEVEGVTVHGFRFTFRDWVSELPTRPAKWQK